MGNRLMIVRKAKRKTQSEVAAYMGINQNTYSYWEKGKHIDSHSMLKLAEYFGVSVDFLSGRKYRVTVPPEQWDLGYDEDYKKADENQKQYLEYLHGSIQYVDSLSEEQISNNILDEKIKIAVFGGDVEVTDEMWQDIRNYAEFVKMKYKK